MKSVWKYIMAIMICTGVLESCVISSVVEDIDETIDKMVLAEGSKSYEMKEGYLSIHIYNNADNTLLEVDSIEICNVLVRDEMYDGVKRGNIVLDNPKQKLLVQTFKPWNPIETPQNSKDMYVKIYGSIYSYIGNQKQYLICSGPMYFTFKGEITENQTTEINFELYDNCPLYCQVNGKMEKALQSISFSVSVEDWEE